MTRILVALDDTEASRRAANFVHEQFGRGTDEVLALSVARVPPPWIPVGVEYGAVYPWPESAAEPEDLEEAVRSTAAGAGHTIHHSGLDGVRPLVSVGDPAEEITRAAREHQVDFIVVGSHHKNVLERFLVGSVSEKLVREGTVPVLVVP